MSRQVILHADDFGFNRQVTGGILLGFAEGILTSTSLLANAPDAGPALEAWKALLQRHEAGDLPSLAGRAPLSDPSELFDLGVHLNLTQGRPLTGPRYPAELLDAQGRFPGIWRVFSRLFTRGARFQTVISEELSCQIEFLFDRGLRPTHLNGHQYVELVPVVAGILPGLLRKFDIPAIRVATEPGVLRSPLRTGLLRKWPSLWVQQLYARRFRQRIAGLGLRHADVYFGTAHAGRVDLELMKTYLAGRRFQAAEIGLHPALPAAPCPKDAAADGWADPLAAFRAAELDMLRSGGLIDLFAQERLRLGRLSGGL